MTEITIEELPDSARGRAFAERVAIAYLRHGRVAEVIGVETTGARAAGWMLDDMLASPGATLAVGETRELGTRAAVKFVVRRPELSAAEDLWVVLDERDRVRATASVLTLPVLLHGADEM